MIAIEAVNTRTAGCLGSVKVGGREISAHCLEDVGITRSKLALKQVGITCVSRSIKAFIHREALKKLILQ